MKKGTIIPVLALTIAVGIGATAFASSSDITLEPEQRLGLGRITFMKGYNYISNILEDKLGITDADIEDARNEGKSLYELAIEEGITQEELKDSMIEARINAIDEAILNGIITEEEADILKERLNNNIENCTESFGQRQGLGRGQGRGQGRGMMGNGQGRGCFAVTDNGVSE